MGLFTAAASAIRQALSRTREALGAPLRALLSGPLSPQAIDEIESRLMRADVGPAATAALIGELRQAPRREDAAAILKERLKDRLGRGDRALHRAPAGPTVFLFVGVNGSGKTTSLAKLAGALKGQGQRVLVAAADTYRAGAVSQLEIWAQRLGVEVVKGAPGADPAAVAFDAADAAIARGAEALLIDTAGRLHTQQDLMRQLTKIRNVVKKKIPGAPHETLLVLDATAGQNALRQARLFKEAAEVTGIFLAKLDGTARGGIVIAIHDELAIPVKLVGVGETAKDVEPFDPDAFVEALFDG
jgi:fused signal recognition particle receptor